MKNEQPVIVTMNTSYRKSTLSYVICLAGCVMLILVSELSLHLIIHYSPHVCSSSDVNKKTDHLYERELLLATSCHATFS